MMFFLRHLGTFFFGCWSHDLITERRAGKLYLVCFNCPFEHEVFRASLAAGVTDTTVARPRGV